MTDKKRKISVRKVLQALVTLIVTGGCIAAIMGATQREETLKLRNISMHVRNAGTYTFIDKQDVWNLLIEHKNIKAGTTLLSEINVREIEQEAHQNPWVSEAEVYIDNRQELHIYLSQRKPVARVFFDNGQSFYLDSTLRLLPLSDMFTYYTTIVTNVPLFSNDSLDNDIRAKVLKLVRFIDQDTFWSAQIAQVIVTPEREFELIPVLGNQTIRFGDTSDIKGKFNSLFAFYRNILSKIGWDKYSLLDLRFDGQVVASPAIKWKPPTRNGISNMDWVKNIMESQPKEDAPLMALAEKPAPAVPAPTAAKKAATVPSKPATQPMQPAKKPETSTNQSNRKPAHSAAEPVKKPAQQEASPEEEERNTTPKYIYKGDGNQ